MKGTGPQAALAWLATIICASLAVLAFYKSAILALGLLCVPAAFLSFAALLLFPPLWRRLRSRPLNVGRIAAAFVAVYLGLLLSPLAGIDPASVPPPHSQH